VAECCWRTGSGGLMVVDWRWWTGGGGLAVVAWRSRATCVFVCRCVFPGRREPKGDCMVVYWAVRGCDFSRRWVLGCVLLLALLAGCQHTLYQARGGKQDTARQGSRSMFRVLIIETLLIYSADTHNVMERSTEHSGLPAYPHAAFCPHSQQTPTYSPR
jgi:hypothetical protein